jgi:hypothetical protein
MMAKETRLTGFERAEKEIVSLFDGVGQRVWGVRDLERVLRENRKEWGIPKSVKFSDFLEFLGSRGLQEVVLRSETYPYIRRYGWRNPSNFEIALSIRQGSYLSHGTAVFLHGLNDQLPKTIYVNQEQSAKPGGGGLIQERIDTAFARSQRMSNYEFRLGGERVVLVNGKHSDRLEVGRIIGPNGESLEATKLERTLVDIVVRPAYSGGIYQVLEAFKTARERVSTNVLVATLKKLAYIYPYHQAIGFLMQRAGYSNPSLSRLKKLGIEFDFYLVHGMKKREYDQEWHLFFPEGF